MPLSLLENFYCSPFPTPPTEVFLSACYSSPCPRAAPFLSCPFPAAPLPGSRPLQGVQVPLIDRRACDRLYHVDSDIPLTEPIVLPGTLCAGYARGSKDACQVRLHPLGPRPPNRSGPQRRVCELGASEIVKTPSRVSSLTRPLQPWPVAK